MDAAVADGSLTIGEVKSLPSLIVETAGFYQEVLQPAEEGRQTWNYREWQLSCRLQRSAIICRTRPPGAPGFLADG